MDIREFAFTNRLGVAKKVRISTICSAEYAFYPWKSSELLSQAIYSGEIDVSGRRVLELGAGTGLCGISALKNNAASVVFTDLDDSRIKQNLSKNCSLNNIFTCEFLPCDWNRIPDLVLQETFDLVLASDCLFDSKVVTPFVETLSLLLYKNKSSEAFIAYEDRGSSVDLKGAFWKVGLSLTLHHSDAFDNVKYFLFKASTGS
ncbi:hypothetical protein Aperf_G00000052537 [Anoplocephala perfoliata]